MRVIVKSFALGCSLFSTLFALNGWSDTSGDSNQKPQGVMETETVTVTPINKVTPREAQAMSSDAVSVLRHVADARGYIKDNHPSLAKDELNQAQALLDIIRAQMPTVRIKDRLAIAQKHLQFNETQKVTDDLVPVYSDLTYAEDLIPSQEVKGHLEKAKEGLKSGNKQQAMNELRAADASINYTEVDLPLAETQQNVKAALVALGNNQPQKAEKSLLDIENRLQTNFDSLIAEAPHPKTGNPNSKTHPTS